jgi:hypothetical protein
MTKTPAELTRELMAFVNEAEAWSPYRAMARNVFMAYPALALTLEQINGVARAIEGLPKDASLQDALTFLVKRKALRSRKKDGRRLYEVNY